MLKIKDLKNFVQFNHLTIYFFFCINYYIIAMTINQQISLIIIIKIKVIAIIVTIAKVVITIIIRISNYPRIFLLLHS